jgi:hypothetical protein
MVEWQWQGESQCRSVCRMAWDWTGAPTLSDQQLTTWAMTGHKYEKNKIKIICICTVALLGCQYWHGDMNPQSTLFKNCLLYSDTMSPGKGVTSTLKMEAARSSKTSVLLNHTVSHSRRENSSKLLPQEHSISLTFLFLDKHVLKVQQHLNKRRNGLNGNTLEES